MNPYTEDTDNNKTNTTGSANPPATGETNAPEPVVSDDHSGDIPKPGNKKEENPRKNR